VEIVRQYSGLEVIADARRAVQQLLSKGWLERSDSYGTTLVHQAPKLRDLIATELGDQSIAGQLSAMRANLEPYVKVLGPMNDQNVYLTFMELLRGAQQEICLPMLATTPYDDTVSILQERADAGVRVRILLAVPALVAQLRGETMRQRAKERIPRWAEYFQDRKTVSIRLCRSAEDMELATCVSVDRSVVRLDIYDPYQQRSLEGVMIEVTAPHGINPNLIRVFQRLFDEAWNRSIALGRFTYLAWFVRRWWKLALAVAMLAAAFVPVNIQNWSEILIGISGGIVAPLILEGSPKAYEVIRKWRTP
jgi:hypothetical protein